ncbi:hypothetical protein [Flagellimonas algicola]|uniref:Uncharacterized protein n=1 Tax=Flagellimonas algicola TaxID=2583815 RepID=A0ABY2WLN8_9FLAO|nr:hypothetical protein FGG15_09025 [Allomuricauda algicola]
MIKLSGRRGIFILLILFFLFPQLTEAQCAMCRAVVESEADGKTAEGINNGIVYLMAIPYILVGGLFYFVYKKLRS